MNIIEMRKDDLPESFLNAAIAFKETNFENALDAEKAKSIKGEVNSAYDFDNVESEKESYRFKYSPESNSLNVLMAEVANLDVDLTSLKDKNKSNPLRMSGRSGLPSNEGFIGWRPPTISEGILYHLTICEGQGTKGFKKYSNGEITSSPDDSEFVLRIMEIQSEDKLAIEHADFDRVIIGFRHQEDDENWNYID